MRLILQIALGVFLGTLVSQLTIDGWHTRQEYAAQEAVEKNRAEHERVRLQQGEHIRALLLQSRQSNTPDASKAAIGFTPDDAQTDK